MLEDFGSWCVVVTTGQRGSSDVFSDGFIVFEVETWSSVSIACVIRRAVESAATLREMAIANRRTAGERYHTTMFTTALRRLLEAGPPA